MSTFAATVPPTALDQNIHCHRCGYNLRTLSPDALCPECSTPISSSLNPTLLRFADPSWTRILTLSLSFLLLANAIQLLYAVAFLLLDEVDTFFDHATPLETANTFAKVLGWLAVFLLGTSNPQSPPLRRLFSIRRIMRIAALVSLVVTIFADVNLWDTSGQLLDEIPIKDLCNVLTTFVTLLYLLQLSKHASSPRLTLQTRIGVILIPLCGIVTMAFNYLSTELQTSPFDAVIPWVLIGAATYELYLYFLFRRTLRKCTTFARQYWHFCSPVPQPNSAE
jgi:hypothetical protein